MTIHEQPDEIDITGATDVAASLNLWLRTLAFTPGDVVKLGGILYLGRSLELSMLRTPVTGVHFDLTQAKLVESLTRTDKLPIVRLTNAHDCVVQLGSITGANANNLDAVQAGKEAYAGISIGGGSTDVVVDGGNIATTWGDFVFIGSGPNRSITVQGLVGNRSGRHAVTARQCSGLTVVDCNMQNHKHLFFDHEPAANEGIQSVEIGRCTSSEGPHGFFQTIPLMTTVLGDIHVHDHTLVYGHYRILAGANGLQRQGITFEHLSSTMPGNALTMPLITIGGRLAGWDGVTIADVQDHVTRPDLAVKVWPTCTGVSVDLAGFTRA